MKTIPKPFITSLVLLTIAVALVSLVVTMISPGLITINWGWLLVLFLAITWGVFYGFQNLDEKKISRFANYFMISSMLKIFLLLIVISVYAFSKPGDALKFSITLFVYYVTYMVFEVYWMLRLNKTDDKK